MAARVRLLSVGCGKGTKLEFDSGSSCVVVCVWWRGRASGRLPSHARLSARCGTVLVSVPEKRASGLGKLAVQDKRRLRASLAAPSLPVVIVVAFRRAILAVYYFLRVGGLQSWRSLLGFALLRLFQADSALAAMIFQSLCCQHVLAAKSVCHILQRSPLYSVTSNCCSLLDVRKVIARRRFRMFTFQSLTFRAHADSHVIRVCI
jgi:hypothetical protein